VSLSQRFSRSYRSADMAQMIQQLHRLDDDDGVAGFDLLILRLDRMNIGDRSARTISGPIPGELGRKCREGGNSLIVAMASGLD
jgi:hypothetical protein